MKIFLQLLILSFLIIVTIVFYSNYFTETSTNKKIGLKEEKETIIKEEKSNLIKNLRYEVKFDDNSQYIITADLSELTYKLDEDGETIEIVKMQIVTATIINKDSTEFNIVSDKATFNNSTYSTIFTNNVRTNYLDNEILSEKLELNFIENIVTISNNVIYEGLEGVIKSDNIKINLLTKNAEIFMNNSKKK